MDKSNSPVCHQRKILDIISKREAEEYSLRITKVGKVLSSKTSSRGQRFKSRQKRIKALKESQCLYNDL